MNTRAARAVTLLLLGAPVAGSAQAVLHGVVRDADGFPLDSILVEVADVLRDTTSDGGRYRVVLAGAGDHVVRFARVGYAALLTGMQYVISGDDASDSLRLDIDWPSLADLAGAVCRSEGSSGIVIGRVRKPPAVSGTEAIVGWDDIVSDPRRKQETASFAGFGVPVHPDGSFVLCRLPRDREIRVYARLGLMSGPVARLRSGGRRLREVQVEPPGPE